MGLVVEPARGVQGLGFGVVYQYGGLPVSGLTSYRVARLFVVLRGLGRGMFHTGLSLIGRKLIVFA